MTWIKICGITNLPDAKKAVELGADALGFIFAPSKRQIEPEKVREIIASLPPKIEKIGVFLISDADEVKRIAEYCGLTGLQFHGSESPQYCKEIREFYQSTPMDTDGHRQVIKAFRVNAGKGWDEIIPYVQSCAIDKVLLDTYVEGLPGGTGRTFPWELAANFNWDNIPVIIAGGINPSNVVRAIKEADPFGVDVGSGVEREIGKKDHEKLYKLFREVNK
ncbi:MAG: hypothetical protein APF76_06810 [Desulfitibacter sp. BRH_c19]|nr:MAG: hypothetical protein APF76_06810 [Desulfitibacter sp. BRH_c19]